MNTVTLSMGETAAAMPRSRVLRAYVQEARTECLRYLRMPGFLLPTLLFPSVFYVMFGILLGSANGPDVPRLLLASYGVFGVMAPGLFGFGVSLALERETGLLTLKRALPMPPGAYLVGKMSMAMVVAVIISLILLALAVFAAHVVLSGTQMATLFIVQVLGVLPFCAMGLLVGTLVRGQGAPGIINMVYLPMAFLSGLWFPLQILPEFIQRIAPIWPSYHLRELCLSAIGMGHGGVWIHVAVLASYTVAFVLLASRRLRRHG
ncbi:ABC-2 type transport system permease protein [Luteibacter sp. Sphag1AF]|uniref:ABC transporter permease n=1 Tax=Luteibacter sp. Sphag1AF TaxID=2587031 RepID=UPI00161E5870|nr:ABC transporter permease [Luteibacter sp. Sphag1AF]MBB3228950.1 ABC-2 type transport system permease protein [Luteibacter sp. Sphag1AF]